MTNSFKKTNPIPLNAALLFALILIVAGQQKVMAQNTLPTSGNVGIGTTSPSAQLHVSSTGLGQKITFTDATSYGGLVIYEGSTQKANFTFTGSGSGSSFIGGANALQVWNVANGPTIFGTNASERLRIDSSGNVGIGTTSPATLLHVAASSTDTITRVAQFYQPGLSTANNYSFISVGKANATDQAAAFGFLMNSAGNDSAFITVAGDDPAAGTGLFVRKGGNVGIGLTNPQYKLDVAGNTNVSGNITATGSIAAKYQDMAEWVPSSEQLSTGTVVVLDTNKSNQVISSTESYDTRVAGVVSEQPGIALGESGAGKVLVATTGRVLVKVDASKGAIHIGDLLVSSDIPGVAMKSEPVMVGNRKMHTPGTLIGKALEPMEKGSGRILVLLSLQ